MDKKIEKKEIKFKPGVGCDIGTSFIVTVRQTEDGTFVNKFHRNVLFPMDINDESADLLDRSSYFFVKTNDKYYVIGDDALNLVNAIGKGNLIRPMKDGLLNPNLSNASELLFYIIKAIVGEPIIPNENLRFTTPANAIDKDTDNLFHQVVLSNFFNKLGYNAKSVNEALCVAYDSDPKMKKGDEEISLTGITTSWGAGLVNVSLVFRGLSLVEFSCSKSGDNIDEQTEKVTGVQRSKIIKIKENVLDLDNINMNDRVQAALSIYYDETVNRVLYNISNRFKEKSSEVDGEIEFIIAGGTALIKGFVKKVEQSIEKMNMPFRIFRVRLATEPFLAVSQGACIRAMADYEKSKK